MGPYHPHRSPFDLVGFRAVIATIAVSPSRRRGQPLLALLAIIALWVGMRAVLIASSAEEAGFLPKRGFERRSAPSVRRPPAAMLSDIHHLEGHAPGSTHFRERQRTPSATIFELPPKLANSSSVAAETETGPRSALIGDGTCRSDTPANCERVGDIWPKLAGSASASGQRWSGDAWLFLRGGGGREGALASLLPSYGASQFGVVVRRSFGPGPRGAAFAYLRIAGATTGEDGQAAAGLGLRPSAGLPIAFLAEARLQKEQDASRVRPALAAVSEIPPVGMPLGLEATIYAQGGWVGGRNATPFFDAQANVEKPFPLDAKDTELRLGGGVWTGGQRGAARLDIGPRAALRSRVAGVPLQAALDWRFRVAGDARPGSGLALTLSTGF